MTPLVQTIVQGVAVFALAPVLMLARDGAMALIKKESFNVRVWWSDLLNQFRTQDLLRGSWVARVAPPVAFALAMLIVLSAPLMVDVGLLEVFADPVTSGMLLSSMFLVLALGGYDTDRNVPRFCRGMVLAGLVFFVMATGAVLSEVVWPAVASTLLVAFAVSRDTVTRGAGHSAALVRMSFAAVAIALGMTAVLPYNSSLAIENEALFFIARAAIVMVAFVGFEILFSKIKFSRAEDQLGAAAIIAVVGLVLAVVLPLV